MVHDSLQAVVYDDPDYPPRIDFPSRRMTSRARIAQSGISRRLNTLGFSEADADLLASMRGWSLAVADGFLKKFYDVMFADSEFADIVRTEGVKRWQLEGLQRRYFVDLFGGMPDTDYVEGRLQIGAFHAQLGFAPEWYFSAQALYVKHLFPLVRRHFFLRRRTAARAVTAIVKLLNFDTAIVLEAFIEGAPEGPPRPSLTASYARNRISSLGLLSA